MPSHNSFSFSLSFSFSFPFSFPSSLLSFFPHSSINSSIHHLFFPQLNPIIIQQVKNFFIDHHNINPPPLSAPSPKPALSEHSTSNPAASSSADRSHFRPPLVVPTAYATAGPPPSATDNVEEEDEEEDDSDEADAEADSDSEAGIGRAISGRVGPAQAEPSELMQLEMSEDIRLGSPEDASNNLDSDSHVVMANGPVAQPGLPSHHKLHGVGSFRAAELSRRWPVQLQQQGEEEQQRNSDHLDLYSKPTSHFPPIEPYSNDFRRYCRRHGRQWAVEHWAAAKGTGGERRRE